MVYFLKNLVNFFGFYTPLHGVWGILYEQHLMLNMHSLKEIMLALKILF